MSILTRRRPIELAEHRYGRLAPKPVPVGDLTHYVQAPLPTPPATNDAPPLVYPMALNNQYGDCTIAAVTHVDQATAALVKQPWEYPGDPAIKAAYFRLTGGPDSGLVETVVLTAWMAKAGLFNHRLFAFAPINVKHLPVIRQATWLTGAVYTGVMISQATEVQFAQGKTFALTHTALDSQILGGHAVPIVGYNPVGPMIVTWGKLQQTTWEWWLTYAEEAYAVITGEIRRAGRLRQVALEALTADLQVLQAE